MDATSYSGVHVVSALESARGAQYGRVQRGVQCSGAGGSPAIPPYSTPP